MLCHDMTCYDISGGPKRERALSVGNLQGLRLENRERALTVGNLQGLRLENRERALTVGNLQGLRLAG